MERLLNNDRENESLAAIYEVVQSTSLRNIIAQPIRGTKFGVPRPAAEFSIVKCLAVPLNYSSFDLFVWNMTQQQSFNFSTRRNFLVREAAIQLVGKNRVDIDSGLKLEFIETQLMIRTLARVVEEMLENKNIEPNEENVSTLLALAVYHSYGLFTFMGSYTISKKKEADPITEEFFEYIKNGFSLNEIFILLTEYGTVHKGHVPIVSAKIAREYDILDLPESLAFALIDY
jgi:hypothetical protein